MRVVGAGWRMSGLTVVLGVGLSVLLPPVGIAVIGAAAGMLWFFRDPDRRPEGAGMVSPADGRVTRIDDSGDRTRVEIFMGLSDVHVNRAPLGGTVTRTDHRSGGYWPAFTKAADRNERVRITLVTDWGPMDITLIAGTIARRISTYLSPPATVDRGQRIGHIAFGSRVDVDLPQPVRMADLRISRGDRVLAGETVLVAADHTPVPGASDS